MSYNFLGSCFATIRLFMTMSIISGLPCHAHNIQATLQRWQCFLHGRREEWMFFKTQSSLSPGEVINTAAHASSNLEKTRHRWKGREMFEQQGVDRHFLCAHINSPAMLIPWESRVFSPLKVNSSWSNKILLKDKFIYFMTPWWFKYNAKKNRFRWKLAAISIYKSEHFVVVFYFKNVRFYGIVQCFDYQCIQQRRPTPDSLALTVAHLFSHVPCFWLPNTRVPLSISSLISRVAFHWRFFWQRLCKYFRLRKLNRLSLKLGPWLR